MSTERLRDRVERATGTARKLFLFGMVAVVGPAIQVARGMAADMRDRIRGRRRGRPEPDVPRVVVEEESPRDPDDER